MSVVKINAIVVPKDRQERFEERFRGRAGEVEKTAGFEWFELLRPLEGTDQYLVYTRWESEEAYRAWEQGQEFARAHEGGGDARPTLTFPACRGRASGLSAVSLPILRACPRRASPTTSEPSRPSRPSPLLTGSGVREAPGRPRRPSRPPSTARPRPPSGSSGSGWRQ
jgi:heme-degrading monooxygenase HmoA